MSPPPFSLRLLLLALFLFIIVAAAASSSSSTTRVRSLRRLSGVRRQDGISRESAINLEDFKTYYYDQTLDHFNYAPGSYATFQQRYMINSKYWGGAKSNAPIFVYLGEEAPLDSDAPIIGFLPENAPRFKALLVYIEHRFYGKSVPYGSFDEALRNKTTRGYFNSAQALADYAEVLTYLKQQLRHSSPVIVFGGSYGGMLASWFRLKYPHIALGALASSAPILYFDDITPQNGYYSIVTRDFKEASESCYKTIKKSWAEIDKAAATPNGLLNLSKRFKTCKKLNNSDELKDYLDSVYASAAQYDQPPYYPVTAICRGIDGASEGTGTLDRIFAGLLAYEGRQLCFNTSKFNTNTETDQGWKWQYCSEMVMPIGRGENDTMFEANPFNLSATAEACKSSFGVPPRPHWITTHYGGHDIKLILHRFASNIIFSNGLRDPYSSGGVLQSISETVVAVSTKKGSHCLDILPSTKTDPKWLVEQRKAEINIIKGWISQYNADLKAINKEGS